MASVIAAGTTAGTALNFSGDTSGSLQLQTNGTTTAVTIDTSQNVGIGSASPIGKLHLLGNGTTPALYIDGVTRDISWQGNLQFGTWDGTTWSETMRIDSSGNVGIGTTSPACKADVAGAIRATSTGTTASGAGVEISYGGTANTGDILAYDRTGAAFKNLEIRCSNLIFNTGGGGERARIDSSGNVLVTNPAGLGYGTGAGGTVTQATNKGTGVTLNKPTGQITMNGAALGSGAIASFQVSNSLVTQNDTVITSAAYTGAAPNPANYRVEMTHVQTGIFNIRITNITGGSLSDALVINFAIIKGATS